jgi:uncharacterized protein YoxC
MMENGTILNVILIILCAAFLLFAGFAIPFLLQIWQTAKGMSQTLQVLNESLPSIMKNLEEITTKINRSATTVNRQVEDLAHVAEKIRGTLNLLVGVEEIVRKGFHLPYASTLRTSFAVSKGIRVFMQMLLGDEAHSRRSAKPR